MSDPSCVVQQQNAIDKLGKLLRDWLANDVVGSQLQSSHGWLTCNSLQNTKILQ